MSLLPIRSRLVWNDGRDIDPAEVRRWGKAVEDIIDGWCWTHLQQQSNESKSSTTVAASNTLLFAMAANTKYLLAGRVAYSAAAACDFRWRHAGPASPTRVRLARRAIVPSASAHSGVAVDTAYSSADIDHTHSSGTEGAIAFEGIIENGANAGNWEFRFGVVTASGDSASVLAGSWIAYRKVTP